MPNILVNETTENPASDGTKFMSLTHVTIGIILRVTSAFQLKLVVATSNVIDVF